MSLAEKRHHAFRHKQRALKRLKADHTLSQEHIDAHRIGVKSKTPKSCSCWMCGNQRKHFGARHSEQKRITSAVKQLIELE